MASKTPQKAACAGGTLLSVLANLHGSDLLKTAVLAGVGAVVSFMVSWLLRRLLRRFEKEEEK